MFGEVMEVAAVHVMLWHLPWQWNQAVEAWPSKYKQTVLQRTVHVFSPFISGGEWEVGEFFGRKLYLGVSKGYLAERGYCYSEIKLCMNCLLLKQIENRPCIFDKGGEPRRLAGELFFS